MDEADRLITVSELTGTPLPVRWMRGEEMLCGHLARLFAYLMELASTDENIHPRDVLGERARIKVG
jgi:uncharacterized protein involved in type VI secretion and phage assembly